MSTSRSIFLSVLLTLAAVFPTGCYQEKLDKENSVGLSKDPYPEAPKHHAPTLHVLIWPDTIPQELLDDFQNRYGIHLEITEFSKDSDAYQMLKDKPDGWDVVMLSQYMANRMRLENLLSPVKRLNAYLYHYINTEVINKEADPQMKYFIPYDYSTLGICFNIDLMAGFPRRWDYLTDALENPYLYGRIIVPDDMRYTLAFAMLYNGANPQKATLKDLDDAKKMLIANIRKFGIRFASFNQISSEMEQQDSILAVTWSGSAAEVLRQKQECRFLLPEGKTIISVDGFCIPAHSPEGETASLFIEYMLQPYNSLVVANHCLYPSVNRRTMKFVDRFIINGPSCFMPPEDQIVHMKSLSPEEEKCYEAAWAEIRSIPIDREKIKLIPAN